MWREHWSTGGLDKGHIRGPNPCMLRQMTVYCEFNMTSVHADTRTGNWFWNKRSSRCNRYMRYDIIICTQACAYNTLGFIRFCRRSWNKRTRSCNRHAQNSNFMPALLISDYTNMCMLCFGCSLVTHTALPSTKSRSKSKHCRYAPCTYWNEFAYAWVCWCLNAFRPGRVRIYCLRSGSTWADWGVGRVTDMSQIFSDANSFNGDISKQVSVI